MSVVVWLGLAWLLVSCVAGVVIGTALRLADHREQALDSPPVPLSVVARVPDRR
jgi:hypothetical protein